MHPSGVGARLLERPLLQAHHRRGAGGGGCPRRPGAGGRSGGGHQRQGDRWPHEQAVRALLAWPGQAAGHAGHALAAAWHPPRPSTLLSLQIVTGYGEAGNALVTSPDVGKLIFVGSTHIGRKVSRRCPAHPKPVPHPTQPHSIAHQTAQHNAAPDPPGCAQHVRQRGARGAALTCHLACQPPFPGPPVFPAPPRRSWRRLPRT